MKTLKKFDSFKINEDVPATMTAIPGKDIKLELTSELLPVVSVGSYHGELAPDKIWADAIQSFSISEQELFWQYYENDLFNDKVLEYCNKYFKDTLMPEFKKHIPQIKSYKIVKIYSPKEYNYGDDLLYFDFIVSASLKNIIKKETNNPDFIEFLEKTYKSYDGFINFMPNSAIAIIKELNDSKGGERAYAAYFNYVIATKFTFECDDSEFQQNATEWLINYSYILNFLSDKTPKNVVKKLEKAASGN